MQSAMIILLDIALITMTVLYWKLSRRYIALSEDYLSLAESYGKLIDEYQKLTVARFMDTIEPKWEDHHGEEQEKDNQA